MYCLPEVAHAHYSRDTRHQTKALVTNGMFLACLLIVIVFIVTEVHAAGLRTCVLPRQAIFNQTTPYYMHQGILINTVLCSSHSVIRPTPILGQMFMYNMVRIIAYNRNKMTRDK